MAKDEYLAYFKELKKTESRKQMNQLKIGTMGLNRVLSRRNKMAKKYFKNSSSIFNNERNAN